MITTDDRLSIAVALARGLHGNEYFDAHVYHVYSVVERLQCSEDICIAALLHDVVEDTQVSLQTIQEMFGDEVATMVDLVTTKKDHGKNRAERHAMLFPMTATHEGASLIKVADRYANVCLRPPRVDKLRMYQKEHEVFRNFFFAKTEENMGHEWYQMESRFSLSLNL